MAIVFNNEQDKMTVEPSWEKLMEQAAEICLKNEEIPPEVQIGVTFIDNEGIREINREYREIDRATDVLSFPMIEYETPADFDALEDVMDQFPEDYFNPDTGELMLGDIVISVEKVEEQAEKYGHSKERELAFLTAHSMMHLFGYDHMEEDEAKVMEAKQREVLELLGITR